MSQSTKPKDVRGLLNSQGAESVRELAMNAKTYAPQDQPEEIKPEESPQKPKKTLSSFLVDHSDTLGMTWREIDTLRPPIVIDQFLRQGEVMLMGAESKSRKSWLAQDAGFCVASGQPWLAAEDGNHGFQTAQADVHVVDLELNPSEMRFRFAKARGNRFEHDTKTAREVTERFHAYSLDGLNVLDILPLLDELKQHVNQGDLVIVDCLYRLVPDGNETAEVAQMLETLKRFAGETKTAVVLVDHFRKAGDDKARNRFAGSFVKQASASTLLAIEVAADDLLTLNIDARTFHGVPQVFARFNLDTYSFNRVPEEEIAAAQANKKQAENHAWIAQVWKSKTLDFAASNLDGVNKWGISRQGAEGRFRKLISADLVERIEPAKGKAVTFKLTEEGKAALKQALNLHPTCTP